LNVVAVSHKENRQIDIFLLNRNIEAAIKCQISIPEIGNKTRTETALELNSWKHDSRELLFDGNFTEQKAFIKSVEPPVIKDGVIRGRLSPYALGFAEE
jgi:hypothetical protein